MKKDFIMYKDLNDEIKANSDMCALEENKQTINTIKEDVNDYFKRNNLNYSTVLVQQEDDYIYNVFAYNISRDNYTYWSTWNNSTKSLNHGSYDLSYEEGLLKMASVVLSKSHDYIENEHFFNLVGEDAYFNLKDGFIVHRIKDNWKYITDTQLDEDLLYEILDQVNVEFRLSDKDKAGIADDIVNFISHAEDPREALEAYKMEDNYELEM